MKKLFHILVPLGLLLMVLGVNMPAQTAIQTWDFETAVGDWVAGSDGSSIELSTAQAHGGTQSLKMVKPASGLEINLQNDVYEDLKEGDVLSFHVYLSATDLALVNGGQIFWQTGDGWSWNSQWVNGSSLTADAWTEVSHTMPAIALPLQRIGFQLLLSTGNESAQPTLYIDDITVARAGPGELIAIDGERDAFFDRLTGPDDGYLQLQAFHGNDNGFANGNADLSAKMWVAWDDSCFYVYEEVVDDVISMTSTNTWQNDGMELKFDPVPDDSSSTSNSVVGLQMTVLDTTGGITGTADFPGAFFRKLTDDGYVLEAAIPWEDIAYSSTTDPEEVNVAVDGVFGLCMQNHDNDNPDGNRDGTVQWSAVMLDAAWNHTEYLATAKFLAGNKLQLIPSNVFSGATNDLPYDGTISDSLIIDGNRDPWYDLLTGPDDGFLILKAYTGNDNGMPHSDADLSAKIWTAWDDSCFYVYEEVTDDTISMTSTDTWKNDCMELKFDPVPDDSSSTSNSVVGLQMTAQDTTGGVTGTADFPGTFFRKLTDDGYVLEAAIPWEDIAYSSTTDPEEVNVAVDGVFGLCMQNHDNDNPDGNRDGSVQWSAIMLDAAWNHTEYLATAKFLADGKLQLIPSNVFSGATNDIPYDGTPFYMRIDAVKDPFYYSLTRPTSGYVQVGHWHWSMDQSSLIGCPEDNADLSAKLWSSWDDEWFYLYAEITDDTIGVVNSSNFWRNDGLELKVDGIPDDSTQTSVSFGTSATAVDTPDTRATGLTNSLSEVLSEDPSGGILARDDMTDGYVLEMAIKWSVLGGTETIVADVGNVFGLGVNIIDNDGTEAADNRQAAILWAAELSDHIWNTPKMHGTVEFLADNKLSWVAENNMTGKGHGLRYDGREYSGIKDEDTKTVAYKFNLKQNYPNPFNPITTISYGIEKTTDVRLTIYDILGHEVATLVNEIRQPGFYHVQFDASRLASGLYLYRIEAGSFVQTQKMMLLK